MGFCSYLTSNSTNISLFALVKGSCNRAIRATEYNDQSSRSHAILQLGVEVEAPGVGKERGRTIIRQAKLNLVDLAGSERAGADWADDEDKKENGAYRREMQTINTSLSALGN